MYAGFPDLPLAAPMPTLDYAYESTNKDGCVQRLIQSPVRSVRLSYAALAHLLYLSTQATKRRAVFGRLCGLQVKEQVVVTDVQPNPRRHAPPERETQEDMRRRQQAEEQESAKAFAELSAMHLGEQLDTFQAGTFVISSAMYNPFSLTLLSQLMNLASRGQPMVMIYYDPFRTAIFGRPYLRAFVPTQEFVQFHELDSKKDKHGKSTQIVKDSKLTTHGVMREVPIELEVDTYQKLGLASVEVTPVASTFDAIQSDTVTDYVTSLVHSVSTNTDNLIGSLNAEVRANARENNQNAPLAQRVDTLLALQHLREQTAHLEAVCDSVLLNASLLRDM